MDGGRRGGSPLSRRLFCKLFWFEPPGAALIGSLGARTSFNDPSREAEKEVRRWLLLRPHYSS